MTLSDSLAHLMRGPQNKDKTHCKRGHEFTSENTYLRPNHVGGRPYRICRTCGTEWHRTHYWGHKDPHRRAEAKRQWSERHPARARDYSCNYNQSHRAERRVYAKTRSSFMRAYLDSYKTTGCVDCGTKNLIVLDLDHVRGAKVRSLSQMVSSPFAVIDAEIAKCEVRCGNCHRIQTQRRKATAK